MFIKVMNDGLGGKETVCRANKMGTLSACDMPEARRTAQAECVTVCPRRRRPGKKSYGQKAECAGATTRQDAHIAEYRLFRQVEAPA